MDHPTSEIALLREENLALRSRVADLEREVELLKTHPTLAQGLKGETLIAQLTGGELTGYAGACDVVIDGEVKIEVKFSKLNVPAPGSSTRRWNWSKPLGWKNRGKDFDFLLLVGDKDPRFPTQYPDDSPYVFFLLPRNEVEAVMTKGGSIGSSTQITTNLSKALSAASQALKKHMVGQIAIGNILKVSRAAVDVLPTQGLGTGVR